MAPRLTEEGHAMAQDTNDEGTLDSVGPWAIWVGIAIVLLTTGFITIRTNYGIMSELPTSYEPVGGPPAVADAPPAEAHAPNH
jgi:hypothetical protein